MRYIRTKDGIVDTKSIDFEIGITKIKNNRLYLLKSHVVKRLEDDSEYKNHWKKIPIIAQADTIEELCDEFVVSYEINQHITYQDLEWARYKASRGTFKYVIYGAIWTEKGLIYVAKMNEKGELELL